MLHSEIVVQTQIKFLIQQYLAFANKIIFVQIFIIN